MGGVLQPDGLWCQSRCALLHSHHLRKTPPAAFIKQVVNGSKIQFGKVNVTSWICTLSQASSFHPLAVSSYLSNWSYWWGGADPSPLPPGFLPPSRGPGRALSVALRPHVSSSIPAPILCSSAHWTLFNPWRRWASPGTPRRAMKAEQWGLKECQDCVLPLLFCFLLMLNFANL